MQGAERTGTGCGECCSCIDGMGRALHRTNDVKVHSTKDDKVG